MDKRKKGYKYTRYFHYIIGKQWEEWHNNTNTRKEVINPYENYTPPKGWVIVAVCGYHDIAE